MFRGWLAAAVISLSCVGAASASERPGYVALGSSFASGPGVAERAEPGPCSRSTANYPRLLARQRGLSLIDVSCAGATTKDVLRGGQNGLGPQLDAVTADTRLVTVTIGGNDVYYSRAFGALACQKRTDLAEERRKGCVAATPEQVERGFAMLQGGLREIASGVHARAPEARLIFVGYERVLPERGTCPDLALTDAEADELRAVADRLDAVTAEAARAEGAEYLATSRLSLGHDACAADPWINGIVPSWSPDTWSAAPFHPNAKAMASIARALDRMIAHKPR